MEEGTPPGIERTARSKVRLSSITDGTSVTILAGERPPSDDFQFGWWFAGAGYDNSGIGDVTMGAEEAGYCAWLASNLSLPNCASAATYAHFQPGNTTDPCHQVHWWSLHSAGGNFLRCDGSVKFYTYSMDSILPALCTIGKGEVVNDNF